MIEEVEDYRQTRYNQTYRTGIHPTRFDSIQWCRRQTTFTALRYRTRVRPEYLITHNILTSDVDSI
ncbi:MAG: hypothetical protein QNJ53_03315 [Pleurocapsa sp. MO_192.B19]|nr:hypothetical protein [Pleurocapsa sp. MO_192.B19]